MKRFAAATTGLAMMLAASASLAGGAGSGSFKGLSNHETKGKVEVINTGSGWEIHLKDSFWFDGAPDPRVGFGNNGKFV
ncbi:MAG: twin-arginine translocation pathway signal protein, partial [Paracoccaceae bacterium]